MSFLPNALSLIWKPASITLACVAILGVSSLQAEPIVKSGEFIAFLGDSITQFGYSSPGGYVQLVISGLAANGITVTPIPAGISGHESDDMLKRVQMDVIDKKPTFMTLSCGVNDVMHKAPNGVPLEEYKKNITAIVDQAQAAGIKVVILTATMIKEDPSYPDNVTLVDYNAFLHSLAAEKGLPVADLNAAMQKQIKETPHTGNLLTGDGVHMNPAGNQMMAIGVLKAFGLNDAQIAKAQEKWLDIPKVVEVKTAFSLREFQKLSDLAAASKVSLSDWIANQAKAAITEKPAN